MTILPFKKRVVAGLTELLEPLDLSVSPPSVCLSPPASTIAGSLTCNSSTASSPVPPMVLRAFQCPECPHTFPALDRLKAHQRRHRIKESGRYTCKDCNKSFVQQSSLITHRRIHTGERPFKCNVCYKTYGDLSTYTKHLRTHTGEKPYQCWFCPKAFSQSGNCLRHMKSVHKKKYYCE